MGDSFQKIRGTKISSVQFDSQCQFYLSGRGSLSTYYAKTEISPPSVNILLSF